MNVEGVEFMQIESTSPRRSKTETPEGHRDGLSWICYFRILLGAKQWWIMDVMLAVLCTVYHHIGQMNRVMMS